MENLTIEQPTAERLLIYSNDQEINRLTSEVQERARMLNEILKHGLSQEEIKNITSSKFSIEQYVENQLLRENKEYARMKKAGIQGVTATLSNELQSLKDSLLQWLNIKAADKYRFLKEEDNTWKVDEERLQHEFEMRNVRVYVEGEQLEKWRKAEQLTELLKFFNIPWTHLVQSSALTKLLDINGLRTIPRWQYFQDR